MNRLIYQSSLIALAAALSVTPVFAAKEKPAASAEGVVATVNGKAIPKMRADALVAAQVAQGQPDSEELRKMVREELVRREILAQESFKKGFDKKPEVKFQMDMAAQTVLINAYMSDFVRSRPISPEVLKKEYDTIKLQLGDKEYKARHILVEKESEAADIIAKLAKGEKFEDLAKQSKDPGSRDRGGDLGWAAPSNYVKPFSDAMTKLEKGKYTDKPVKSDFGYHVIQLEDSRELKLPGLDEAKPQLTQRLQQQMVEKHIGELRAKAKVD